jgi:endonuclease YncB( thermonuclease family)
MIRVLVVIAVILCGAALPVQAQGRPIESYAVVRQDASLLIRGKVVRLAGIYIPDYGQTCRFYVNPRVCGSRAAVALEFKIQRFVRCQPVAINADGSLSAFCETNYTKFSPGEDLGAYLIAQGWALAAPDAPFEYYGLERIAAANGRGVWGFNVDQIIKRRRF